LPVVLITVFESGDLSRHLWPFGQRDNTLVYIGLQHLQIVVGRVIVIEVEMIHPNQQMILYPFLHIGSLILKDGTEAQVILLGLLLPTEKQQKLIPPFHQDEQEILQIVNYILTFLPF
jgi:hypothetical protein